MPAHRQTARAPRPYEGTGVSAATSLAELNRILLRRGVMTTYRAPDGADAVLAELEHQEAGARGGEE